MNTNENELDIVMTSSSSLNSLTDEEKQTIISFVLENSSPNYEKMVNEEKKKFSDNLKQMLENSAFAFLERYGSELQESHLAIFKQRCNSDLDVAFILRKITESSNEKKSKASKNRRLEFFKNNLMNSPYTTLEEMRLHAPALFEELGIKEIPFKSSKLSENLLYNFELDERREQQGLCPLPQLEQKEDEEDEEDNDEFEDYEGNTAENEQYQGQKSKKFPETKATDDKEEDEEEDEKIVELEHGVLENFLAGKDSEIDYSKIDADDWIRIKEQERDEEDKFFEGEDEEDTDRSPDATSMVIDQDADGDMIDYKDFECSK